MGLPPGRVAPVGPPLQAPYPTPGNLILGHLFLAPALDTVWRMMALPGKSAGIIQNAQRGN